MSDVERKPAGLTESMTETQFDNGYWYTTELKVFAARLGVPSASRLRKDELEKVIRHFIRNREVKTFVKRRLTKARVRDVDKGLSLDLPIVNYTSNRETKDFIEREAAKLVPGFRRKPGTRYLLNRWREEQLSAGRRITYGHLVKQAIVLNKTKQGPLRLEHGRYINFISDFMAQNARRSQSDAVRAWDEVKRMDAPKTYAAWAAARAKRRDRK
jgi:SAP domain-containing new25